VVLVWVFKTTTYC